MTTEEVLKECTVEGNVVKLPDVQLDRKAYLDVKKHLEGIGGKWKGGKVAGFVFDSDPSELLGRVSEGEKINLKKDFQFFATPETLSNHLVNLAKISEDDNFLEPSAGQGNLVNAIRNVVQNAVVDCYELMPQNQRVLESVPGVNFLGEDFTKANHQERYSRIIANPPFTKGQDIEHLQKMYELLSPEGLVACITSVAWMTGKTKKPKAFREWLCDHDDFNWERFGRIGTNAQFIRKNNDRVYIEMVEAGAFQESGTSVKTAIVIIEKPNPFIPWEKL